MLFTPKLKLRNALRQTSTLRGGGLLGQTIVVVPRANSSFRRVRLKGGSKDARKALELQIVREASAEQRGFKITKSSDNKFANVWTFNKEIYNDLRLMPESLLYAPVERGARLIQCIEGIEGQVWNNQELVASRWWPSVPADKDWMSFLRVVPVELEELDMVPRELESLEFANDIPALDVDLRRLADGVTPKKVGFVATLIGMVCFSYFASQLVYYTVSLNRVEAATAQISQEAQLNLSKRRRALKIISDVQKFNQFGNENIIIDVLADVAGVIGKHGISIERIELQTNEIKVTLSGAPRLSGPQLVSALEKTESLSNVNVSEGRAQKYVIQADISESQRGAVSP